MGNLLWDDFTSSDPHSLTAQTPNHFPVTHICDKGYAEPLGTIPLGHPPALAFVSHKERRAKAVGPARPFKEGWLLLLLFISARWLWTSQFSLRGFLLSKPFLLKCSPWCLLHSPFQA